MFSTEGIFDDAKLVSLINTYNGFLNKFQQEKPSLPENKLQLQLAEKALFKILFDEQNEYWIFANIKPIYYEINSIKRLSASINEKNSEELDQIEGKINAFINSGDAVFPKEESSLKKIKLEKGNDNSLTSLTKIQSGLGTFGKHLETAVKYNTANISETKAHKSSTEYNSLNEEIKNKLEFNELLGGQSTFLKYVEKKPPESLDKLKEFFSSFSDLNLKELSIFNSMKSFAIKKQNEIDSMNSSKESDDLNEKEEEIVKLTK